MFACMAMLLEALWPVWTTNRHSLMLLCYHPMKTLSVKQNRIVELFIVTALRQWALVFVCFSFFFLYFCFFLSGFVCWIKQITLSFSVHMKLFSRIVSYRIVVVELSRKNAVRATRINRALLSIVLECLM